MAANKYFFFRQLMDLVTEDYEITDADMNNYSDEIEIFGQDEFGNTIRVRVAMKYEGGENNGN